MPVPFGFGVSDFVAVGTLAWDVYKSCKGAPESFGNISIEVLSLHAVLKEAEEAVLHHPLPSDSHARLETVYNGCQLVLEDLQELLKKYESLAAQSKRTWDRISPETLHFALQDAIERRLPKVVAALTANGANVNQPWSHYLVILRPTISNWTPLCKARHGHDIFDILLNSGANANARLAHTSQNHFTLLHLAAPRHDCFAVRKNVEHGADFNSHSAYGSPLMLALARPETHRCAELLIELGADVNYSRRPDGSSNPVPCPLEVAIVGTSIPLIDFLLGKGATMLQRNIRMAHALVEGDVNNIPSIFSQHKRRLRRTISPPGSYMLRLHSKVLSQCWRNIRRRIQ